MSDDNKVNQPKNDVQEAEVKETKTEDDDFPQSLEEALLGE